MVWENGRYYQPGLGTPSDPSGLSNPMMKAPTSGMFNNMSWKNKLIGLGILVGLFAAAGIVASIVNGIQASDQRRLAAAHQAQCDDFWTWRQRYASQGMKIAAVQQGAMKECPNAVPSLMGSLNGGQ